MTDAQKNEFSVVFAHQAVIMDGVAARQVSPKEVHVLIMLSTMKFFKLHPDVTAQEVDDFVRAEMALTCKPKPKTSFQSDN